jgi:outer membrane protein assembly factor BamA
VALPEQPRYVHGEASITSDTRNSPSRPTNGAVYRAVWATYSDRDTGAFSFRRYEAEAAQFVPLAAGRVVVALHAWTVGSETDGGLVPFYLMPSLGGSNTLRGYTDFRFHDRNLAVVSAESRVVLMTHVDFAAFVDAGNVAPRMSDLNFDKRSYGIGLRLHSDRATFARLEIARSADGWRLFFRTNDPFRLSRLSRRTATVPFVP